MKLKKAIESCHVRSAVYRKSKPEKRYWYNHEIDIIKRVPFWDKFAKDWEEYDPRDYQETSIYG